MPGRRILAASTAFGTDARGERTIGPLVRAAIGLSPHPHGPRVGYLGTAKGDSAEDAARTRRAFAATDASLTIIALEPEPNVPDLRDALLTQDVVLVGGGSVAHLLEQWRLHDLGGILREVWDLGVVLSGYSAGSLCWHVGGPTDSFGPELRVITDGLGLLPYGNAVHLDADAGRRPALQAAVADGTLPTSFATDDGVALLYEDTTLVDVLAERDSASAYRIERHGSEVRETRLRSRLVA